MTMKSQLEDYYYRITQLKIFRVMSSFDNHIIRNLREDKIETRPSSTNGLWCCLLLPTIIAIYSLQYKVSLLYGLLACISIGYLFYCILFIIFMSVSCLVLKMNIFGGCTASSFVSTLLMYSLLNQGLIFSLFISLVAVYLFSGLLRITLTKFPKTFTIGEAMVVVQGVSLFFCMVITRMLFQDMGDTNDKEMEFVNNINLTVLSSVGIIVTALYLIDDAQKTLETLSYITSLTGVYALIMLHILIGIDCLITIPSYILLNIKRVQLFILWFGLSVIAGVVITIRTQLAVKATTVTRKVFHILASVVFMSGILVDVHFMTLAAGCGLGLIILVEALRKSNIDKVSPALESAFKIYSDEKDAGAFAMTPIYLYVGLACPLILVPTHKNNKLELLSGVLSIGIGDTAASWFGSKYGFNKWGDSNKSLEGTVFNIITQVATVYFMDFFDLLHVQNGFIRSILAAVIAGLAEAKTEQIDNLILPLITIIAFQITWFVS